MAFSETRRQSLHVTMVLFSLLLRFLPIWGALICALVALLHNLVVLPVTGRNNFYRPEDQERGYPVGMLAYPVTVFLLILLFGSRMYVAGAAWAILSFGDGFATIVGRWIGKHSLPWNRAKSWEGTLAYALFGGSSAVFVAWWISSPSLNWLAPTYYPVDPSQWTHLVQVCFAGAILAAFIETFEIGIDDNLSAPLAAGFLMFVLWEADVNNLRVVLDWPGEHSLLLGILAAAAVGIPSLLAGFVSRSGTGAGLLVGTLLVAGGGIRSFAILVLFFLIGSSVSKFGYKQKEALGAAQDDGGRRGSKHAAANCMTGVLLGLASLLDPVHSTLYLIGLVAAFATALADTTSSELGSLYGKRPILLTTFQTVPPGTEGAVSVEGTLIGVGFATLLSSLGWLLGLYPLVGLPIAAAGAFVGMSFESYLGAATKSLDNELLNFLNTVVGATAAILLAAWLI